ncbi:MAG: hypothetical protein AB1689_02025, partial [Thermodesulfobacteriota bacterium]
SRPELVAAGSRLFAASPFVHPGHEVGLFLEEREARRRGFSVEPEGNTVQIVFRPLGGSRIALPPLRVTAVSPSALYFDFPDTRDVLGRVVAGPMEITIRSPRKTRRARQPVALPPANDVLEMLEHGSDVSALGAVDRSRRLWIPLEFSRFGPGMPMPTCPVELTQKTAFAVKLVPTETDSDDVLPHASYTNVRKARLYFGDFLLNGINVYGEDALVSFDVREFKEGAAIVCGLNDALSLVLMVPLKESALGPSSRIVPLVADGSPLPIRLANISAEPVVASELRTVTHDSFGNQCPAPPEHDDD